MAHPSRRKGHRFEREVVDAAEAHGLEAERAFASDGRSLGCPEETDVLIRHPEANVSDCTRVQCKRRKKIASYIFPPSGADVTILRQDRDDSYAVVPLSDYLDLLRATADEDT